MFIEVDVQGFLNSPMPLVRMFDAMEEPRRVTRVVASDPMGVDRECHVTGWSSESGPCPAYAALVEDSGEGVAMLVYGGDEGIRLRPASAEGDWDLDDSRQWGEACLLLDKDVPLS